MSSSRIAPSPQDAALLSGLDSLYVSYFLDVAGSALDFDELASRKELVRVAASLFGKTTLGSESFALMPYGKRPYSFVLSNRAFEVRLAPRLQPACHVQFYSEALWHEGLDGLESRFRAWCDSLGLKAYRREVVARADWAFDYHLPEADVSAENMVTRATKDATYREHGQAQTISLGKGDVVVRLYDKCAEIAQKSGKAWFFTLWGREDGVWRVEFQVRGARLKEAGIVTLTDLRELQNDLLRELAGTHTTLRRATADTNRSRWPLHPLWVRLLRDIAALPQAGLVRALDEQGSLVWRRQKQLKALYGSLKGLAAVQSLIAGREEAVELESLLRSLRGLLRFEHAAALWKGDVERRMTAYRYGKW